MKMKLKMKVTQVMKLINKGINISHLEILVVAVGRLYSHNFKMTRYNNLNCKHLFGSISLQHKISLISLVRGLSTNACLAEYFHA
jgi:hypothetical protein